MNIAECNNNNTLMMFEALSNFASSPPQLICLSSGKCGPRIYRSEQLAASKGSRGVGSRAICQGLSNVLLAHLKVLAELEVQRQSSTLNPINLKTEILNLNVSLLINLYSSSFIG